MRGRFNDENKFHSLILEIKYFSFRKFQPFAWHERIVFIYLFSTEIVQKYYYISRCSNDLSVAVANMQFVDGVKSTTNKTVGSSAPSFTCGRPW